MYTTHYHAHLTSCSYSIMIISIGAYLTVIWLVAMTRTASSSGSTSPASASHNRYALPSALSFATTDRLICVTTSRWTHGTAPLVPPNTHQKSPGPSPDLLSEYVTGWYIHTSIVYSAYVLYGYILLCI